MVRSRPGRAERIYALVKDLHTYLGLLNFSHLLVFAIAGLVATFSPAPENRAHLASTERMEAFEAPAGATVKEIADAVYAHLDLPLTRPVPEWAFQRDADDNLLLNFYTVNGVHRVTVGDGLLRIETERTGFWRFVSHLHATVLAHNRRGDWRMLLWTAYIEFALWSLTAMALSGLYVWLSSRPAFRPALYLLAAGAACFVVLYVLTR